ncbi:MAG: phage/plasmid replication protein [Candidatus Andersenbacteria bacterium]
MIDTVILTIPKEAYQITNPKRFDPTSDTLRQYPNLCLVKCVNNPTDEDKKIAYHPRMSIIRRSKGFGVSTLDLRVEFSAPKILHQNNVDETEEDQFNQLTETLQGLMQRMGVVVQLKDLRHAKVSSFHACKNILLQHNYTVRHVLKQLAKVNVNKKMDFDSARFRNSGQALTFYAKSNSFIIYDKIRDITYNNGRSIDNDQTAQQLQLFQTKNAELEILRLEARLSNRTKLKTVLKELGYMKDPTFEYIFKKNLCQKIMLRYWKNLVSEKNYFIFDMDTKPQRLLQKIITKLDVKPKQAIYLTGLKILCKDADGIMGLRQCLEKNCSSKTWSRITKDFDILNSMNVDDDYQEWLGQINDELARFPLFRYAHCRVKQSKA